MDSMAELEGWQGVLESFLASPSEDACAMRALNYGRCVAAGRRGPGGPWTDEVVEALMARGRNRFDWPVRPAPGGPLPPGCKPPMEAPEASAFHWRWVDLPIPWLDTTDTRNDIFPLPVLVIERRSGGGRAVFLLSHRLVALVPQE